MKSVQKRSRWIMGLVVVAVATATIGTAWASHGTSRPGNPSLTLNLSVTGTSTTKRIVGTGTYSDPEGICTTSNKTVSYTITLGTTAGGSFVTSGSTTTSASGNYTFTSGILAKNTDYFVSVTVQGSLTSPYHDPDVCPDVTTTGTINT